MKTTLGELKSYIRQRLAEVKDHYPQLQPGTKWITNVSLYAPQDTSNNWRFGNHDYMVRGQPNGLNPARAQIQKGTEVEVVDRVEYDRGEPPRNYPNYSIPARQEMVTTPVIEWNGVRYAIYGASPSDFIRPNAGLGAEYTWDEAIVYSMGQLNRAATPKEILAAAATLKGLGGQANSGLYMKNAVYKGLVKYTGKEGRSSYYELTDKGREMLAELEEEEQRINPRPPPTVIRRRREEP